VQNKFTVTILFVLLLLAGLGLYLQGNSEFQSKPTIGSISNYTDTEAVQEPKKDLRALFKPRTPRHSQPPNTTPDSITTSIAKPDIPEKLDLLLPEKVSVSPPKRQLLQGRQKMQVATKLTKIGFDGQALPDSALQWSCARDIKTGLLWETKLFDAGVSDVDHRYSWYDPARATQGYKNNGDCYGIECDTHAYTAEMNRLGLCGSRQWRVPTFLELESLLDRDYFNPVINQEIFFHARGSSYWTQSQLQNNPELIMQIDFFNGTSSPAPIRFKLAVRLVSE
jgi:hypothetical protein